MDDDILNTPFWLVRFYMDGLGFLKPTTVRSVKERVEQVIGKVSKTRPLSVPFLLRTSGKGISQSSWLDYQKPSTEANKQYDD